MTIDPVEQVARAIRTITIWHLAIIFGLEYTVNMDIAVKRGRKPSLEVYIPKGSRGKMDVISRLPKAVAAS